MKLKIVYVLLWMRLTIRILKNPNLSKEVHTSGREEKNKMGTELILQYTLEHITWSQGPAAIILLKYSYISIELHKI